MSEWKKVKLGDLCRRITSGGTPKANYVRMYLGSAALASEISNKEYKWYNGNTVVILGENYYSDQVVTVKNPMRIGTYSYTNKGGML